METRPDDSEKRDELTELLLREGRPRPARPPLSRRAFFGRLLLGAGLAGLGGAGYSLAEARRLDLAVKRVPLDRRTGFSVEPLRVLHLSDLHVSPPWVPLSLIARALEAGLELTPDVVCLTGDYVTKSAIVVGSEYRDVLARAARTVPTFASLGNHDGGAWLGKVGGAPHSREVERLLEDAGIRCLVNESVALEVRGRRVWLAGAADLWSGLYSPAQTFAGIPADNADLTLALSHNPDTKDRLLRYSWDVLLSGHTHGGQVVLPFAGPLILPVTDRRYYSGLYRWEGRWLHVTRGVGNLWGVRFNCRPEVALLEIG